MEDASDSSSYRLVKLWWRRAYKWVPIGAALIAGLAALLANVRAIGEFFGLTPRDEPKLKLVLKEDRDMNNIRPHDTPEGFVFSFTLTKVGAELVRNCRIEMLYDREPQTIKETT
ncbi:hypothetical protein [Bradyrhizobium macuxiense]|uniref:hypothetical protein n=1 Tax=Bradyrhizobium macuxiense TaxID=1755647 RepID=UPI0011BDC8F5|nr:hypothetical protein [Bradyrhizobium macuxiense]